MSRAKKRRVHHLMDQEECARMSSYNASKIRSNNVVNGVKDKLNGGAP